MGDLRHKVDLASREAVGQTPGDWDSSGITFTTYATVWCAFKTIEGTSRFANTNIDPSATHLIYIRHRTDWRDIEAGNVFALKGDRRFRVLRVTNNDEDSLFDIIEATERGEDEAGEA